MFSSLLLLLLRLHGFLFPPPPPADLRPSAPQIRARGRFVVLNLLTSPFALALLLFVVCFFCGLSSAAPAPSPSAASPSTAPSPARDELSYLLSLKASWKDPFNRLASWNTSLSRKYCDAWRGVACNGRSTTVTSLDLAYFSLSGPLPAAIANLHFLQKLDLSYNQFTGNIPQELGSLSSLKSLLLRHNSFNGSIPESLFNATSLQYLLLEGNNFSGNISSAISSLGNLRYFAFASNALSGHLPASITSLSKLVALYGGDNRLTGTIPVQIGGLSRLVYLDLGENLLTGDIPSSLGSCTLLKTLDLHQNNLSGSISPSLGNLTMLRNFNLSYNNLSGEVPTNGVLATFSAACFEGNPYLCGILQEIRQCVSTPPPRPPSPPSLPPVQDTQRNEAQSKPRSFSTRNIAIGVAMGASALLLFILSAVFLWRRRRSKEAAQIQRRLAPDLPKTASVSKMEMFSKGFRLSYDELVAHAGYYDTAHVLGKGRFAIVYRSDLPGGANMAIKVFKNPIPQAAFEKEVEALESASRVSTLMPIRGYFSNEAEKAIFFDYMEKGTLYDMLHNNPDAPAQLDWAKRLTIATGVAQAVVHLHKGSNIRVLHKDLKSSNVLLNEDLHPLVADFGLIGLVSKSASVETPGYTPPELRTSKKYTEKTDVYSFGVVLLELLTGKKPVSFIGDRQLNLVTWALRLQRDGRGREVFSANLVESCPYPDYPDRALNVAVLCLSEQPTQRPTMSEIASILEGLASNNSPMRSPGIQQDKPLLL